MKNLKWLIFGFLLVSCAGVPSEKDLSSDRATEIQKYWNLLPQNDGDYEISFRRMESGIALYTFRPPQAKEWVILSHGYLDHVGTNSWLIRFLLEKGYGVAAFDLPGHGLSVGTRADVVDFAEYGAAWAEVMKHTQGWGRRTVIGHSTACAGYLTFSQMQGRILPEKVIFIAPLVRNKFWDLARFFSTNLGWMASYVPAMDSAASRDKDWIELWKNDIYTEKNVPVNWFKKLSEWEILTHDWRVLDGSTYYILQGTRDGVVDWEYNLPFLESKYPGIHITMIPDGWHGLQYDHEETRVIFYALLELILTK